MTEPIKLNEEDAWLFAEGLSEVKVRVSRRGPAGEPLFYQCWLRPTDPKKKEIAGLRPTALAAIQTAFQLFAGEDVGVTEAYPAAAIASVQLGKAAASLSAVLSLFRDDDVLGHQAYPEAALAVSQIREALEAIQSADTIFANHNSRRGKEDNAKARLRKEIDAMFE